MNIVISGLAYPVTAAFEYLVRAAKRLGYNVKSVGPYHGTWIPWHNGMKLPDHYDFKPDIPLPTNSNSAPISFIESRLENDGFITDLWLDVNAGFYLDGRPKKGIKTTFLTDPHVLRGLYDNIAYQYDKVFCSQTPYMRDGEVYCPYGYDAEWHSPLVGVEKIYDVACIGNTYESRVQLFARLHNSGIRTFFRLGPAKEDARLLYNQSIMGLNWSSMKDMTARVFELAGLGICPVINRVPDLSKFFTEDVHYLGFDYQDEAVEKIKWALANSQKTKEIAENARKNVIKHSWDDRLKFILEECKLT